MRTGFPQPVERANVYIVGGRMFIMAAGLLEYEAKLNTNAVIGAQGNLNTAYLEFSNNP